MVFRKIGIIIGVMLWFLSLWIVIVQGIIEPGDEIKWGGIWYTPKEEIQKDKEETKNSPEEVYTTFRKALLNGDIDLALSQINENKRGIYKSIIDDDGLSIWTSKFPVKIMQNKIYDNLAAYYYENNTNKAVYAINFIKDSEGNWQIDSM